jgi:hypothetical protein
MTEIDVTFQINSETQIVQFVIQLLQRHYFNVTTRYILCVEKDTAEFFITSSLREP